MDLLLHRVSRELLRFLELQAQEEENKGEHGTDAKARSPNGAVIHVVGSGGDDIGNKGAKDESPVDHGIRE